MSRLPVSLAAVKLSDPKTSGRRQDGVHLVGQRVDALLGEVA